MSLRLIHNSKVNTEAQVIPSPVNLWRAGLIAVGLFLALKLPVSFVANNPEELRDYDHYVRMSSGETPYKDFVWIYGPIAPIVYGTYLKIFPQTLWSVRLFTLSLWGLAVFGLVLIFARYYSSIPDILLGTFFASGVIGYPSYSHNHILATVATIFGVYFYLRYKEENVSKYLTWSYLCVLGCLFTRPLLMGYGLFAAFWAAFYFDKGIFPRARWLSFYAGLTLAVLAVGLIFFGRGMLSAFAPLPWAILESKGYPNLHFLVPRLSLSDPDMLAHNIRQIRAALETFVFYGHYFVWPTFLFTLLSVMKNRTDYRAAAICGGAALVTSADLLHYGFVNALGDQAMFGRGQYFLALSAVSVFLILWRPPEAESNSWKRFAAKCLLLALGFWAYLPLFSGINQLSRYTMNEFSFPTMTGILTHPDRRSLFEAVAMINSKCDPAKDTVVVSEYDPGLGQLLNCPDLFGKDAYLFTRGSHYTFKPGENPYAPEGGITNAGLIDKMVEAHNPRFIIMQGPSPFLRFCSMPGWQKKMLGEGIYERALCWRE